jgi:TPR repeat protein
MPQTNETVATPAPPPAAATPQAPSPPVQSPVGQHPSTAEIAALVTRGDAFLSAGDFASARLFYERAADAGDSAAALRLGATFDPNFLGRVGIRGNPGDPAQAASWYRRARDLGDAAAAERLKNLERQPR